MAARDLALLVGMTSNGVLRATGDATTPAAIMIGGMAVNLGLDPLLIFGFGPIPAMGLEGAALATVTARWVMVLAIIGVLVVRDGLLQRVGVRLNSIAASWRELLSVAAPSALARMMVPLSLGVLTAIVAAHGKTAVAAFGAGMKVDAVLALPVLALAGVLTPFIGQNKGGARNDRVRKALRIGQRLALWTACGATAFMSLGGAWSVAGAFSIDAEVQQLIGLLLIAMPIGLVGRGVLMTLNAGLNATGSPWLATALVALRTPILAVGCGWVGGMVFGAVGVFRGMVVADLIAGLVALYLIRRRFYDGASDTDAKDRTTRAERAWERHRRSTRRLMRRPSGIRAQANL